MSERGAVRVALPAHLRTLAGLARGVTEVSIRLAASAEVGPTEVHSGTIRALLDALEEGYPMLRGTIREHGGGKRRAYLRFYALGEDLSHLPEDTPLPTEVLSGAEPFIVMGAISGG